MTKLEIEAIRKLPEEYVCDGTCTCLMEGDGMHVVAMNARLQPSACPGHTWI